MSYHPKSGHMGEGVFWTNGRVTLYRYCDGVFELFCEGVPVMPVGPFERLNAYLWAEFFLDGLNETRSSAQF